MDTAQEWTSVNLTFPLAIAVLASVIIPAAIAWMTSVGQNRSKIRTLRTDIANDFLRATAEFEAAIRFDSIDFEEGSEVALENGKRRHVSYPKNRIGAAVHVQATWRSIVAQTRNLSRKDSERQKQMALLTRAVAFVYTFEREFDVRKVAHFPDVISQWVRTGRMDFDRLEVNLNAITGTPNS